MPTATNTTSVYTHVKLTRSIETESLEKNNSGISGEHKITPENESLSPYLTSLSPENNGLSPDNNKHISTEYVNYGDNGDNGVSSPVSREDERIGFKEPLYYCRQHPHVQNIHLEEIERHIQYSRDHV